MSITREEVGRIAHLARLRISGSELEQLSEDLNRILDHVDTLRSLDSDPDFPDAVREVELSPTRNPVDPDPDPLLDAPVAFAPDFRDSFFVVPPPPGVHAEEGGA